MGGGRILPATDDWVRGMLIITRLTAIPAERGRLNMIESPRRALFQILAKKLLISFAYIAPITIPKIPPTNKRNPSILVATATTPGANFCIPLSITPHKAPNSSVKTQVKRNVALLEDIETG
jgi:hypothetical protein